MGLGNDNNNVYADNNYNNGRSRAMTLEAGAKLKTHKHLWQRLCSFENLEKAYRSARKHKTKKIVVRAFDKRWGMNLYKLSHELRTKTYRPRPLRRFVLRDPKTRVISVSDFRDRVVHHALINVLKPIFEPSFIHDSYASMKGKGTLKAINRFDTFKRKVSRNNTRGCYVLKADIKHYFDTVDHEVLLGIIRSKINDENVIWLTKMILGNHKNAVPGKGMPLGNWTSQFFANLYLNELDRYVKHDLKARNYIRYVDDFVIMHHSKQVLSDFRIKIKNKLEALRLELHPNKCSIISLDRGISFLGFRVFYYHKLLRKKNITKLRNRLADMMTLFELGLIDRLVILESLAGWNGYAMHANTFRLRNQLYRDIEAELFRIETSLHS